MYGLIISLSIFIALLCVEKLADKSGLRKDLIWEGAPVVIISGIAGARLYHVLDYFHYYVQNPMKIFQVWNGGLGIIGAVIAGAIACLVILKMKKEPILKWLDIVAISLPLAQAIGRWANYFNQEVFGFPTKLPWGIFIPADKRPDHFIGEQYFHPLFLYESLLNLILFQFLYGQFKRKNIPTGYFFKMYLIGYGTIRFVLEFLRTNTWLINGINVTQFICAATVLIVAFSFTFDKRKSGSFS